MHFLFHAKHQNGSLTPCLHETRLREVNVISQKQNCHSPSATQAGCQSPHMQWCVCCCVHLASIASSLRYRIYSFYSCWRESHPLRTSLSPSFPSVQGKTDGKWVLLSFFPPSQWIEQIRVLLELSFKLSFFIITVYFRRNSRSLGMQ